MVELHRSSVSAQFLVSLLNNALIYKKVSSNNSHHGFPCCIVLHVQWCGSPLKTAQPLPSRQDMHAACVAMALPGLPQNSTCWTPLLGPRLCCIGWPVKSVGSPMPQPCFVQLCHRRHAQSMRHSMHMLCMLCSCGVAIVMHAAQQQAHWQSPPGKHSCVTAAACCKQSNNSYLFVILVLAGKSTNNDCRTAM